MIFRGKGSGFAKHDADGAIFLLRELNGLLHIFWADFLAPHQVRYVNIRPDHWVIAGALGAYFNLHICKIDPLLLQDADNIHSGTAGQPNQEQLHGSHTRPAIQAAHLDRSTGLILADEGHIFFPIGGYFSPTIVHVCLCVGVSIT
jgi:hypothetical protein